MSHIDLELLKQQKQTLVTLLMNASWLMGNEVDALDGVVNLLDSIQDELEGRGRFHPLDISSPNK